MKRTFVAGPPGSGKTTQLIERAHDLHTAGAAARILIVTFSQRCATRFASFLSVDVDGDTARGVRVQTAQGLALRLLARACAAVGQPAPRVIAAAERATILSAAASATRRELGADHPLAPALSGRGGLAEIERLVEIIGSNGGTVDDVASFAAMLPPAIAPLDRAIIDGLAHLYRLYRDLLARTGALPYQDLAAHVAKLLADPAIAHPLAGEIDYLLIDDLDRAQPAQIDLLAAIAADAYVIATVDPSALLSGSASRSIDLAQRKLHLDVNCPDVVLPAPAHSHTSIVAEEPLDSAEATYVARLARAALNVDSAGHPDDEHDVLILLPSLSLRGPLRAALSAEGIDVDDETGVDDDYDPAVRYALAWLHAAIDARDEIWERILSSPYARLPAAEVARLRRWAQHKKQSLHAALRAAGNGACDAIGDTARERLRSLAACHDELRRSVAAPEAPGITLHRLLAREEMVAATLVGPTDTGAVAPEPRALALLCATVARLEGLLQDLQGSPPTLADLLDRLEDGAPFSPAQRPGVFARVVIATLDDALDRRARLVVVPGLAERFLPRPREGSKLLSDDALAIIGERWPLLWPASFEHYAALERRTLLLARVAARDTLVLTRALRYDGEDAAVPSPVLLDFLGAARVTAESCAAAGARYDSWTVTRERRTATEPGQEVPPVHALPMPALAHDLSAAIHRHAHYLAAFDGTAADAFIAEVRTLAAADALPVRMRYLTAGDPFAPLPQAPSALPPGAHLRTHELNDYLFCPRRFYYSSLVGLDEPDQLRLSYGMLVSKAAQTLHRLHPDSETVTVEDAEEMLRLLWDGEALPSDGAAAPFAAQFGPRLQAQAMRALAQGVVRRLANAIRHPRLGRRTCATGVRVEVPVTLPDGRRVRVVGTVDRIVERRGPDRHGELTLIDYRSGASAVTPAKLAEAFLPRGAGDEWRPTDYTLPVLFLGVAGNRALYAEYNLPRLPVRELAVVALGKDDAGQPSYSALTVTPNGPGNSSTVTKAELLGIREAIAGTVAAAAAGPHRPEPRGFNPCRGCPHRFACPGPQALSE